MEEKPTEKKYSDSDLDLIVKGMQIGLGARGSRAAGAEGNGKKKTLNGAKVAEVTPEVTLVDGRVHFAAKGYKQPHGGRGITPADLRAAALAFAELEGRGQFAPESGVIVETPGAKPKAAYVQVAGGPIGWNLVFYGKKFLEAQ